MNELTKSHQKTLKEAFDGFGRGIDGVVESCKKYVAVLNEDRDAAQAFMRQLGVPAETLDVMESVGRGSIHPRLLFLCGPGPARLQRAPVAEQERLLNTGVEVLRKEGGVLKKVVKPVAGLSKEEAQNALDSKGQIPIAEQAAKFKEQEQNITYKGPPYFLVGDALKARENCSIPFEELERLYYDAKKANELKKKLLEDSIKRRQIDKGGASAQV